LFAAWGGYKVGTLTMFLADVHIYENHMDQVKEQLTREPLGLPSLFLNLPKECATMTLEENLYDLERGDIELFGYQHHPAIKAEMNR
jgi:thymidylate synthase